MPNPFTASREQEGAIPRERSSPASPVWRVHLGAIEAAVRTSEPDVLAYLAEFAAIDKGPADDADRIVDARLGPGPGCDETPGVSGTSPTSAGEPCTCAPTR